MKTLATLLTASAIAVALPLAASAQSNEASNSNWFVSLFSADTDLSQVSDNRDDDDDTDELGNARPGDSRDNDDEDVSNDLGNSAPGDSGRDERDDNEF